MKRVLAVVMTAILAAGMTVSAFASDGLADKKIALLPSMIRAGTQRITPVRRQRRKSWVSRSTLLRVFRQRNMSPPLQSMQRKAMT